MCEDPWLGSRAYGFLAIVRVLLPTRPRGCQALLLFSPSWPLCSHVWLFPQAPRGCPASPHSSFPPWALYLRTAVLRDSRPSPPSTFLAQAVRRSQTPTHAKTQLCAFTPVSSSQAQGEQLQDTARQCCSPLTFVVWHWDRNVTLAKGSESPLLSAAMRPRAWYMCARSWKMCRAVEKPQGGQALALGGTARVSVSAVMCAAHLHTGQEPGAQLWLGGSPQERDRVPCMEKWGSTLSMELAYDVCLHLHNHL